MTERTREELADGDMIPFLAGVKSYYHRNRELTPRVEQYIDQIIARLREMDGERIEGEILWPVAPNPTLFHLGELVYGQDKRRATLILHPQEPESDD